MARGFTRKQLKHDDFVDAAFSVEQWFEENWQRLAKWVGAVVLVVLVAAAWFWWRDQRLDAARATLAEGLQQYRTALLAPAPEEGLAKALQSFESVADDAGGAVEGQVATYYRGAALLRLGRTDEAVPLLESIARSSSGDLSTTASATLANAYAAQDRVDDALDLLRELANESGTFADQALLRMAVLLRENGREDEARRTLRELIDQHPQSPLIQEAQRWLQ